MILIFAEFTITVCQVEACQYPRSLVPILNNLHYLEALIPRYLLIQRPLISIREPVAITEGDMSAFLVAEKLSQARIIRGSLTMQANFTIEATLRDRQDRLVK